MTQRNEMLALAKELRERNEQHRNKNGDMFFLAASDQLLIRTASLLERLSAQAEPGYVAGFEACRYLSKEIALNPPKSGSRRCFTTGKLISDAIAALPAPATAGGEMLEALKQSATWLRNGDYDTRGGLIEMDRLASVCESALAKAGGRS